MSGAVAEAVGPTDPGVALDESKALAQAITVLVETYIARARSAGPSRPFEPPPAVGAADPAPSPWATPPEAARRTGIPVRTIRTMIKEQVILARLKNRPGKTKQPKFLVDVDEVVRAASASRSSYPSGRMVREDGSAERASADDWVQSRAASARGGER